MSLQNAQSRGLQNAPGISENSQFNKVRDGSLITFRHFDIDLSVARTATGTGAAAPIEFFVAGDSLYFDANPADGIATMYLQPRDSSMVSEAPIYCSPGVIFNAPFVRLRFTNGAQPGKKLRGLYAVGYDFQPGSVATLAVTVIPAQVAPSGGNAGVGIVSGVLLAANTSRKYLLLQNNSAVDVYVNLSGAAAVAGAAGGALKVAASGGTFEMNSTVITGALTAISAGAATSLLVIEGV